LTLAVENGLHSLAWREPRPGANVARAALFMLGSELEYGHLCPISMARSALPALQVQPELARAWQGPLTALAYDRRFRPVSEKRGALAGMAMTEKQGGSDVRANTTRAAPLAARGPGRDYAVTGHKWFCSAPMCDVFLVLAQAEGGLSCFLLPRWTPDGKRNRFFIQRLKDKLGNRSNASSEVEFDGAFAQLIGEEGRGVQTIVEMVNHTRLDCVIGSAGLMRQATALAIHHTRHRSAFGKRLVEQPLMQNVLADLALESEAATVSMMRLARAYDGGEEESAFRRIATAALKYWVCKRAPIHSAEALECHGGNGFVEESPLPRLYREAPLNSIWEGSGNVICLDVLRAMGREPGAFDALLAEIRLAKDARLEATTRELERSARAVEETGARRFVERLVLALQASLLIRHAPAAVADAFCASRLERDAGQVFGTLPAGADCRAVIDRALAA
jgi:putative acyl-CoA dehydrogenase